MAAPKKTAKKDIDTKRKPKKTNSAEAEIFKAEKIHIDSVIAQALSRHKTEVLLDHKDKFKEINHLAAITEEYLSCFSLIGYSLQGEKVSIFTANTSKDEAALVDLLRSTFLEIASNRP